ERLSQRSQLLLTPLDFHNQRLLDRLGDIRCTHGRILVALMEIEHALTCPSTPFLSNHPTFAPQDLSRTRAKARSHSSRRRAPRLGEVSTISRFRQSEFDLGTMISQNDGPPQFCPTARSSECPGRRTRP